MNNKNIKKMFEKNFDIEATKNKIIFKEEAAKETKFKIVIVSICFIMVLGSIFINNKNFKNNAINELYNVNTSNSAINIYINQLDSPKSYTSSIIHDVIIDDNINYTSVKELKDIKVPNDLNYQDIHRAYYIENDDYELKGYTFQFVNVKNDRRINISFSLKDDFFQDPYSNDVGNISKINNIELKIFQYDVNYFTNFHYQGVNFYITTNNIKESELITFLETIIK